MEQHANHQGRRRRRRGKKVEKKSAPVEPIIVAARRPDSPRLEKPTRRMKAASAKPKTLREVAAQVPEEELKLEPKKRREARIIQRKEDAVDDVEMNRRRLLSRFMASEGRAQVTRHADAFFAAGFSVPREQETQLKLLEHFDEARAREAMACLSELMQEEAARQLPLFRQRLRRLEEHADEEITRLAAAELRRTLPA